MQYRLFEPIIMHIHHNSVITEEHELCRKRAALEIRLTTSKIFSSASTTLCTALKSKHISHSLITFTRGRQQSTHSPYWLLLHFSSLAPSVERSVHCAQYRQGITSRGPLPHARKSAKYTLTHGHLFIYLFIYTLAQKTSHLYSLLAINTQFDIRQFLAQMLPRK